MVDFNFSRLPWITFNWEDNWLAAKFNGTSGVPGAVETTVEQTCKNALKLLIKLFKVEIVLLPNNTASVAFLEPKYTFSDCIVVFGESIFTFSTAFKLIDFLELNKIWSKVVLNTNLPELIKICLPEYWSGDWGGFDG